MKDWDSPKWTSGKMAKSIGKPKFSIVIVTREMNDYIREAMPYFQAQTYQDFEILVVSEVKEKEKFPKTRMVYSGRASPAQARNMGVKHARGEIIAFIDDDAYPKPDWLENALKNFDSGEVDVIGGPSLAPKNSTFFQRVSNKVYELSSGKTGIRYGEGRNRKRQKIEEWPTCNFILKKKDFEEAGEFDARYWGGEDSQLCYELINKNKRMVFDPTVEVYHYPRENLQKHIRQTLFWGMWKGFLVKKYRGAFKLTFFIPSLFVLGVVLGGLAAGFIPLLRIPYFVVIGLYLLLLLSIGFRSGSAKMFFPVIWVTFLSQVAYGVGFIRGLLFGEPTRETFNPAEKTKIKK